MSDEHVEIDRVAQILWDTLTKTLGKDVVDLRLWADLDDVEQATWREHATELIYDWEVSNGVSPTPTAGLQPL